MEQPPKPIASTARSYEPETRNPKPETRNPKPVPTNNQILLAGTDIPSYS